MRKKMSLWILAALLAVLFALRGAQLDLLSAVPAGRAGRYVAYLSDATDLTADAITPDFRNRNAFVYDRMSGANTLVTRSATSGQPAGRASDAGCSSTTRPRAA
jgi:hypothetical protein